MLITAIEPCTVHFSFQSGSSPFGQSGIVFRISGIDEDLVLTTGSMLLTTLLANDNDFIKNIQNDQSLLLKELEESGLFHVNVTQKLPVDTGTKIIQERFIVNRFFVNEELKSSLQTVLKGFEISKNDFSLTGSDLCTAYASIIILVKEENKLENDPIQILEKFFNDSESVRKADEILTVSTPFGNDAFFATHNYGIVSNLFEGSLMILSLPLVQGCEGAGVFRKTDDKLIGIVLGSSFYWKKSNVIMTLAVKVDQLFQGLSQKKEKSREVSTNYKNLEGEKSVVLVDAGSSWGCGTLIKFRGNRVVITCTHVIEDVDEPDIRVKWRGGTYQPRVIYKNPYRNKAYDIALLSAPFEANDDDCVRLAKYKPVVGSKIFSIGFPLVPSVAQQNRFSPFIYNGVITRYSPGMMYTDSVVQAGQSGGPIFDLDSRVIGICVSNTRDEQKGRIYPSINMAVPTRDIYRILEKYLETQGK